MKKILFVLVIYSHCLFATWKNFVKNGVPPSILSIMSVSHGYALKSAYHEYKKSDKTIKSKVCYVMYSCCERCFNECSLWYYICSDCGASVAATVKGIK